MKPIRLPLAGLVALLVTTTASAEFRTVLIQIQQDPNRKTTVTIHSDEKAERRSEVGVDEAVRVIAAMTGWGSSVGVHVVCPRGVSRTDRRKVLAAIDENGWLELESFGREVPRAVGEHFLGARPPAPAGPTDAERLGSLKPIMTLEEVNELWKGKPLHGQACGIGRDRDGKMRGAFWNVYLLTLPGQQEPQAMSFGYFQGEGGYLFGFDGPGFRYKLDNNRYVAVEGPPAK